MPSFTEQQREAIDARGSDLLVSAAAGSGKTTVLVARVLALLEEGMDINHILIVTFTRAAAADMREKLQKKLEEFSMQDPKYREQLDRLPGAAIGTIHSFCASLMREYFEAAEVDPAFRIMEPAEAEKLQTQALAEAMDEIYVRGGEELAHLTCGRNAQTVMQLAGQLYQFSRNRPDPWEWLASACEELSTYAHTEKCLAILEEDTKAILHLAKEQYLEALRLCDVPNGPAHYAAALLTDIEQIDACLTLSGLEMRRAMDLFTPTRPGRGKCDAELLDMVKALRKKASERIQRAAKNNPEPELAFADMQLLRKSMEKLVEIVHAMDARFSAEKDARAAYDYGDLEQRALRLMENADVQRSVSRRFDAVFVDEYQDVSDMQEALISKTARPGRLFCVGDVKQSIYRFRLAEPTLFLEKQKRFEGDMGGRLIRLNRNFRSRGRILESVNDVFSRVFACAGSEIEYSEGEALYAGAQWPDEDPEVELCMLPASGISDSDDDSEEEEEEKIGSILLEGRYIARRIRALVGTPLYVPSASAMRKTRYSDIVILARTKNRLLQLRDVLAAEGIPCFADAGGGYTETMEIRHMLALLAVIDNPMQDTQLLAALLSPAFGFTPEEIAGIRIADKASSLYAAAKDRAAAEDALGKKLARFFVALSRYRLLVRNMPLQSFIELFLQETGFGTYVSALPGGGKRTANLELLCDMAAHFDADHIGGLSAFLENFRMPSGSGADYGEAQPLGEGDDVVRLMTAHRSKGLEFPIVFGVQLERDYTRKRSHGEFCAHRTLGVSIAIHDPSLGTKRESILSKAIRSLENLETINEELRLLYVLMTRASDRLILVSPVSNALASRCLHPVQPQNIRAVPTWMDALSLALPAKLVIAKAEKAAVSTDAADKKTAEANLPLLQRILQEEFSPPQTLLDAYAWQYPNAKDTLSPLKLTVTSLTRQLQGPAVREMPQELPEFLGGTSRKALARGTATHAALCAMEISPLRNLQSKSLSEAIRGELDRLVAQELLTPEERLSVSDRWIAQFFESNLGRRMLAAQTVRREWAFNLRMSAKEALGEDAPDTAMLVQGIIDCAFVEDGKWILVDYKTDVEDDPDTLLAHYGEQVRLYRRALAIITQLPVAESCLYLLRHGKVVPVGE